MFFVINNEHDKLLVEDLYFKYKYRLFSIAFNILNDRLLAEDAVHNTFVRIIEYLYKIENSNEYQRISFLCVVCRNISIDMYKNNRKTFDNELSVDNIEERELKANNNPLDIYISNESLRTLIDGIKGLNDTYRDVLMLKYVSECSNEDISNLLSISQPTVRKRLERGKDLLVKSMKGVEYNESK